MPILAAYDPAGHVATVTLSPMAGGGAIMRFTTDNTPVQPWSAPVVGPVRIPDGGTLRVATFAPGLEPSRELIYP